MATDYIQYFIEHLNCKPLLTSNQERELLVKMHRHRVAYIRWLMKDDAVLAAAINTIDGLLSKMIANPVISTVNMVTIKSLYEPLEPTKLSLRRRRKIVRLFEEIGVNPRIYFALPPAENLRIRRMVDYHLGVVNQIKKTLIDRNLRLVWNIAKSYHTIDMERMDLVHEGVIGFSNALDKFEIHRNVRLSTYATWWIRQAISRAAVEKSHLIKVPVKQARYNRSSVAKVRSLSTPITQDNQTLEGRLAIAEVDVDIKLTVGNMLECLKPREAKLIELRYLNQLSLSEVGQNLGISRERVRQIEQSIFKKLRGLK